VLLDERWDELLSGRLTPTAQDNAQATMAPMLDKDTGRLDFAAGARAVCDRVRGCDPWPGAFTTLDGEVMKVFDAHKVSGVGAPGVVIDVDRDGLVVGCGDSAVALGELQLPGRKRMPARALVQGRAIPHGARLGA
jgi:methionyl-tRNA formyltransferase